MDAKVTNDKVGTELSAVPQDRCCSADKNGVREEEQTVTLEAPE